MKSIRHRFWLAAEERYGRERTAQGQKSLRRNGAALAIASPLLLLAGLVLPKGELDCWGVLTVTVTVLFVFLFGLFMVWVAHGRPSSRT
jgi:hypothetical protein